VFQKYYHIAVINSLHQLIAVINSIYLYFEICLKPAVFASYTNTIAPLPIVLKRCSKTQTD